MWTARQVKYLPDFHELLTKRYKALLANNSSEAEAIRKQIEQQFRRTASPLIIDLTGFSTATRDNGDVQAMTVVRLYWDTLHPVVAKHSGVILKDEGDTLYALFPSAGGALAAALALQDAISTLRQTYDLQTIFGWSPESSIGIGYGPLLDIDGDDAFGAEVNHAYGAGEVEAGPNEILLTEPAQKAVASNLPAGVKELKERDLGPFSLWLVVRK